GRERAGAGAAAGGSERHLLLARGALLRGRGGLAQQRLRDQEHDEGDEQEVDNRADQVAVLDRVLRDLVVHVLAARQHDPRLAPPLLPRRRSPRRTTATPCARKKAMERPSGALAETPSTASWSTPLMKKVVSTAAVRPARRFKGLKTSRASVSPTKRFQRRP